MLFRPATMPEDPVRPNEDLIGVLVAAQSCSAAPALRVRSRAASLTMLIGPAQDGTPLEIGILDLNGEDPVIIHAMRLRPKLHPLIRQR